MNPPNPPWFYNLFREFRKFRTVFITRYRS